MVLNDFTNLFLTVLVVEKTKLEVKRRNSIPDSDTENVRINIMSLK